MKMSEGNIFSGLKVVDLSSFVAGPSAATILSDFGADVVKIEPPEGEMWRIGQKIPPQPHSKEPYPFQLANRNKRGVALNLKSANAQQVLERLAKWADVFIVNTPHSARTKLKLEYDDVAQWNQRLIYADLTGLGERGQDAALPGFDLTAFWARSGLLFMTRLRPRFIAANVPEKGRMSRLRSSLPVYGRRASLSRPLYVVQISMGCTIEPIRQMQL